MHARSSSQKEGDEVVVLRHRSLELVGQAHLLGRGLLGVATRRGLTGLVSCLLGRALGFDALAFVQSRSFLSHQELDDLATMPDACTLLQDRVLEIQRPALAGLDDQATHRLGLRVLDERIDRERVVAIQLLTGARLEHRHDAPDMDLYTHLECHAQGRGLVTAVQVHIGLGVRQVRIIHTGVVVDPFLAFELFELGPFRDRELEELFVRVEPLEYLDCELAPFTTALALVRQLHAALDDQVVDGLAEHHRARRTREADLLGLFGILGVSGLFGGVGSFGFGGGHGESLLV